MMSLLESLAVASIVLILGLKIYSTYLKSAQRSEAAPRNNLANHEVVDTESVNSDSAAGENGMEPRLDWGEIFLITVSVGFCAPLGFMLLWKTDKLDSKTKNVMTIVYVAIAVGLVLIKAGS
jgi:hypothetical protein